MTSRSATISDLIREHQRDPWEEAKQRFFQMDGAGANTKYWDSLTRQVVTAINVVSWLRDAGANGADRLTASALHLGGWRSVTPHMKFALGKAPVITTEGISTANSWWDNGVVASHYKSLAAEEIEANAKPFLDLLRLVICKRENAYGDDDGRVAYLVDWLRYTFQNLGGKPPVSPYTYGAQGFFKGTVMNAISKAFGHNTARIVGQDKAVLDKNAWQLFQAGLVMVEEVRPQSHDGSAVYNALKSLITSEGGIDAGKHVGFEQRETPASLWLSSNHPPPFLESGDRRFWVIKWECDLENLNDYNVDDPNWVSEFKSMVFREFKGWLDDEDGYAKLRAFLEYVPTTFEPGDAPTTDEKELAMGLSQSHEVAALEDLLEAHPEVVIWSDKAISDELNLRNPKQAKHLALDVGMQPDQLTRHSESKKPRAREGDRILLSGKRVFYVREGWEFGKDQHGYFVKGPDGRMSITADIVADHMPVRW